MNGGKELSALIDLIYEAVLDNDLWPSVLSKLADAVGAAHVVMPRPWIGVPRYSPPLRRATIPSWLPRTKNIGHSTIRFFGEPHSSRWGKGDPHLRPVGEIYTLDSLMPREESSAATPVSTSGGDRPSIVSRRQAPVWWPKISFPPWSAYPTHPTRIT